MHWIKRVLLQPCPVYVRRHNDIGLVTEGKENSWHRDAGHLVLSISSAAPFKARGGERLLKSPWVLSSLRLYEERHVTSFLA